MIVRMFEQLAGAIIVLFLAAVAAGLILALVLSLMGVA
jgi:hypothetical protein